MPQPELSGCQMRQGRVGHFSPGIGVQVLAKRSNRLGKMTLLDRFLADQELGVNADRLLGRTGQTGEHRVGLRSSTRGPVCQGQIIACSGQGGGCKLTRRRLTPGSWLFPEIQQRFQVFGRLPGLAPGQQGPGLDQADIRPELALGKPLGKRPCK